MLTTTSKEPNDPLPILPILGKGHQNCIIHAHVLATPLSLFSLATLTMKYPSSLFRVLCGEPQIHGIIWGPHLQEVIRPLLEAGK